MLPARTDAEEACPPAWRASECAGEQGSDKYLPVRVDCRLEFLSKQTLEAMDVAPQRLHSSLKVLLVAPQDDVSIAW